MNKFFFSEAKVWILQLYPQRYFIINILQWMFYIDFPEPYHCVE